MEFAIRLIEPAKTVLDYAQQLGPFVANLVALAAILVTFYIARRQLIATTLSVSRRQWIDSLTKELSELLSVHLLIGVLDDFEAHAKELFGRLSVSDARVRLLLNPCDTTHLVLIKAIDAYGSQLRARTSEEVKRFDDARIEVIKTGREVIAAEWSRLKQGR